MKISVSAYSFQQYISAGKMSVMDTVKKAHEMGFEAIEFLAGKDTHFLGVPFSKVPMRPNLLIASIRRDDRTIFPTGSDCIQLGDRVLIVTTESGRFYELNDIFL